VFTFFFSNKQKLIFFSIFNKKIDQTVKLGKGKAVYLESGKRFLLGQRHVTIGDPVSPDQFHSGTFFIRSRALREQDKVKAKAPPPKLFIPAAMPSTGFKTPWKHLGGLKQARLTAPLHSPTAPDAVVLFKPESCYGEK